jgi:hypothetical protein
MECPKCRGSGTVPCLACHGTGEDTTLIVLHQECAVCNGKKEVTCPTCKGLGGYVYQTRFRSESLEYRLASAFSHGHIWQGWFTAYGMETESGELVLSTDPELLLEWFAS